MYESSNVTLLGLGHPYTERWRHWGQGDAAAIIIDTEAIQRNTSASLGVAKGCLAYHSPGAPMHVGWRD